MSAQLVTRATAKPVCDALLLALRRHGVPEEILTDNGRVFTGRHQTTPTTVLFDRICQNNGIKHRLTAPYSPTTTGKVERPHRTMRREFFELATYDTLEETKAALDAWVLTYNAERPHQFLGDIPPLRRFELARRGEHVVSEVLGHASIRMTADVYGHILAPYREAAADAMDQAPWHG